MIKSLKKNQIIIFAIALMLITAGYLNYSMNTEQTAQTASIIEQEEYAGIGDARLVSNNNTIEISDGPEADENGQENSGEDSEVQNNNTVKTANTEEKQSLDAYYTESRLERNKMYSEMLESYQVVLANSNVSAEQKSIAQTEISNINKQKNSIMIAENLIKNKGFEDVIIFINNESVSCVIRADKIEEAEVAQVQSIIQRELSVNVENIHISSK